MNEEEKKVIEPEVTEGTDGVAQAAEPATVSKREELNRLLADEISDYNPEDDEAAAGMLMDYINGNREQRGRFAEMLQEDPRFAQVLADVTGKKRSGIAALVRYFGKDFISAEEGSELYDEIEAAEKERKAEMEAMDASRKEYEANLERSIPTVEEWCKEKGYVMDDFLDRVWTTVIQPVMTGNYSRELCELLDKGLNYDKDTADAMEAGIVKGRNENINRMREERGDGLPKGITSVPQTNKDRKVKRSPLIEAALQA